MANSVVIRTIQDGQLNTILKITGVIDTADTSGTLADPALLSDMGPFAGNKATSLRVESVMFDVQNESSSQVRLLWDATTPVLIWSFVGVGSLDMQDIGGIPNPKPAGWTGKILYETDGDYIGAPLTFSLLVRLKKCNS